MTRDTALPPEALLAQADFVRGLARRLIADEHDAEDLAQQTWLRAVEAAPTRTRSPRAWLASVARNLASNARAADRARRRREAHSARPDAVASVDVVLQREALRRQVVDAVLALPAAYRTVVLLRFYDDLRPRQIAARLVLPGSTVRSRLQRGLALLRAELDRTAGDRARWSRLLVPLAAPLGGIAMKNKTLVLAAVVTLLVAGALLLRGELGDDVPRPTPATPSAVAGVPRQEAPPAPAQLAATEVLPPPAPEPVRESRVLHADGTPAAGLSYWVDWRPVVPSDADAIAVEPPPGSSVTDAEGHWQVETSETRARYYFLWVAVQPGLLAAYRCATDTPSDDLVLPALGRVLVAAPHFGAGDVWDVDLDPAWRSDHREDRTHGPRWLTRSLHQALRFAPRRARRRAGLSCNANALLLRRQSGRSRGAVPLQFPALRGLLYHVQVNGHGFTTKLRPEYAVADAAFTCSAPARQPSVDLEILDPDGQRRTALGGRSVLLVSEAGRRRASVRRGSGAIPWQELRVGVDYPLRVLMDDGEVFAGSAMLPFSNRPWPIRFVRGTGQAPLRIEVEGARDLKAGTRIALQGTDDQLLLPQVMRDFEFAPGQFTFLLEPPQEVLLIQPPSWSRAYILRPNGDVATALPGPGPNEGTARWLPAADLRPLDLAWARGQGGWRATLVFELELTTPRGVTWLRLDTIDLGALVLFPGLQWLKRQPAGLRTRFRILTPDHPPRTLESW